MNQINSRKLSDWLPITLKEAKARGWENIDVVLISGDAYIDHPSFGSAVIARILESMGLKVAIVPQPNWQDDLRDFRKFGKPNLFFAITSGNMDSMVNHYTANKRLRSNDAYTPGGEASFRPDRATTVYSRIIRDQYPDATIIIGGIEASMRRLGHYDYWANKLKPSILKEAKADLLIYGPGEKPIQEIAKRLISGESIKDIRDICQTAFLEDNESYLDNNSHKKNNWQDIYLHEYDQCQKDKKLYAENFKWIETTSNELNPKTRLIQKSGSTFVVVNPANPPSSSEELDKSFDLPYTRLPHPKYNKRGEIPAFNMIKHSINMHRGCFGGCSFCAISAHQGKFISSRSEESILREIKAVSKMEYFKGHLSDLGGPSANMYKMKGKNLDLCDKCKRPSCVFPSICSNLDDDHSKMISLYRKAAKIDGVKKITIGSGIRYDMLLPKKGNKWEQDKKDYAIEIIKKHVSGRLKVAPEHTSDSVLKLMRKNSFEQFKTFKKFFDQESLNAGLIQQLVPYFISSHPGCTNEDMKHLAEETKKLNYRLQQVQDFTPTPMTLATVIYYSGINPYTMEEVYTAKSKEEKLAQRDYFFWYKKNQNYNKTSPYNRGNGQPRSSFSSNSREVYPRESNPSKPINPYATKRVIKGKFRKD